MPKIELTKEEKKMLNKTFIRACQMKTTGTTPLGQGCSFAASMEPVLDMCTTDPETKREAFSRHASEYFNTHTAMFGLIVGIAAAMEKLRLTSKETDITGETITAVKSSLMGPLAGIGDSIFFNCVRVIAAGICIPWGINGNIIAPFMFLLLYSGIEITSKYLLLINGYKHGTTIVDSAFKKGIIPILTTCAASMGAMMIGCLLANNVKISVALAPTINGVTISFQDVLDSIMPGILSLLLWWFSFKKLQKGMSPIKLMFLIMIVCVILAFVGVF
jgi:mannose/fructose/N-acetylgalactosamine-specific phosphotransferase system component IID